ncbi:MAG: CoA pyrophosphatase [Reichenbachiella sp.]
MNEKLGFLEKVKIELKDELPGAVAHQLMDPMPQGFRKWDHQNVKPKQSAVLILLYQENSEWKFPLIQRPTYVGTHSGQIALPGGKIEEEDESLTMTALRETNEEIGVRQNLVTVLGHLSEIYIPPSNFNILPVVGYVNSKPKFERDKREVESIIETDLKQLLNPINQMSREVKVGQKRLANVPCFLLEGNVVWGATAMILSEFVNILEKLNNE